ncbi:MAG: uroporphyrinogen decarboxylase family protein [Armatimonadota bacterium]
MDSRTRLDTAFAFREPDRVPIELAIDRRAYALPEAARLVEFIETEADNLHWCGGINWGFFGLPGIYREEIIEDRAGEFRRMRRTWDTAAGEFYALTRHNYPHVDSPDFHWERRFIETFDDMQRLAHADRSVLPTFDQATWREQAANSRGIPMLALFHPLGTLVRQANMVESFGWLLTEPETMHAFLQAANTQVIRVIEEIGRRGESPWFCIAAHEMFVPPWMGPALFDEWVYAYDKTVNAAIHHIGGKLRSHCHGNCMAFLERMAEMGVDAIEPLEPPPFGDIDLAEAKRRVGGRMVLSGNIPSQDFVFMTPDETRQLVKEAIATAAPGGGFTLRTTGGHANVDADLEPETLRRVIANVEAYIEAGLEYGDYPIR